MFYIACFQLGLMLVVSADFVDNEAGDTQVYLPQKYENMTTFLPSYLIPFNIQDIKPSSVITTRVVNVVTKYVTRNPVCIKTNRKKRSCSTSRNAIKKLKNKTYLLKNKKKQAIHRKKHGVHRKKQNKIKKTHKKRKGRKHADMEKSLSDFSENPIISIQGSELWGTPIDVGETPLLQNSVRNNDLFIEDRLDHLEEVLPHYTRSRTYQTKMITVTKVVLSGDAMATLIVKNCIPENVPICTKPLAKRKKQKKKKKS